MAWSTYAFCAVLVWSPWVQAAPTQSSEVTDVSEPLATELRDLSWVGFQHFQDGSRLSIRTTDRVSYKIKKKGPTVIEIWLDNTGITRRNNQRALPTSYFDSPVIMIEPSVVDDATPSAVITVHLRSEGIRIHDQQRDTLLTFDFTPLKTQ